MSLLLKLLYYYTKYNTLQNIIVQIPGTYKIVFFVERTLNFNDELHIIIKTFSLGRMNYYHSKKTKTCINACWYGYKHVYHAYISISFLRLQLDCFIEQKS